MFRSLKHLIYRKIPQLKIIPLSTGRGMRAKMISKIVIALVGLMVIPSESAPTCDQIANMTAILNSAMNHYNLISITKLRALILRLGFHDCVGGCNGCINFNNPDNAGLQPGVTFLNSTYYANGFNNIISLADFFALATTLSVKNAVEDSNLQRSGKATSPCPVPCFAMKWGRKDAVDCSNDASELPSPTMTGTQMFTYFNNEFGFSKNQVVALMGAHNLGSAVVNNSGYDGKWIGKSNGGISEYFYTLMIAPNVTYTNVDIAQGAKPSKWEFKASFPNGTNAGFMLNTDFEIFYNLTLDANAMTTCKLNTQCGLTNSCSGYCPMSSTFQTAYAYSQNCSTFINDFQSVITLMLAHGNSNLQTTTCAC